MALCQKYLGVSYYPNKYILVGFISNKAWHVNNKKKSYVVNFSPIILFGHHVNIGLTKHLYEISFKIVKGIFSLAFTPHPATFYQIIYNRNDSKHKQTSKI